MSLVISDEILNSAGLSDQELLVKIAIMLFQKERVSISCSWDRNSTQQIN